MPIRIVLIPFVFLYAATLIAQSHPESENGKRHPLHKNSKFKEPSAPSLRGSALQKFIGKYALEGSIIQVGLQKNELVLIVPGAPIQELKPAGRNKFRSGVFKNQYFTFAEDNGKVTEVISEDPRGTVRGKKIANNVEILSETMDSLFVRKKSTEHFRFLFSASDSTVADTVAMDMEKNYTRILNDFHLKKIPPVTVRIYPDLKSFHNGINFPDAPDQVLATAFGKDDIRMVSPNNAGPEGWMLTYFAPHEFTHCVHLNIDYSPNNPRWLWEGVAQYEAGWFFDPAEIEVITKKQFPSLADLDNGMEYMLGYVIIESIKELWGSDAIIGLVKTHGNVQKTLKMNMNVFEEKIYQHIYTKYIQH